MNKKSIFLPVLAAVGGIAGYLLKTRELADGFEAGTGLAVPGAAVPLTVVSLVFGVLFAAAAIVIGAKYQIPEAYREAMPVNGKAIKAVSLLLAVLAVPLSVLTYLQYRPLTFPIGAGPALMLIMVLLSAFAEFSAASAATQRKISTGTKLLSMFQTLALCFLLLLIYRSNGANPTLPAFVWQCLTFCAAVLVSYVRCACLLGKGSTRITVFSHLAAIYCSIILLAELETVSAIGLCIVYVASTVLQLGRLLLGLKRKSGKIHGTEEN